MNAPVISKVLLGTASWGTDYGVANDTRLQHKELPSLVGYSLVKGFSGFDTAQDYQVEPEVFASAGSAQIFSKLSHQLGFDSTERIRKSLRLNLRAMARDSFDGLAVHSIGEFLKAPREAVRIMEEMKELGLIKSWGISLYTLEECQEVFKLAAPDYIQAPVSAIDARFTKAESLEMFSKRGVVLHGRSIFLQGALLMNPASLPSHLQGLTPTLVNIRAVAKSHQMSVAHFLLNSVAMNRALNKLVIGVNSARHVEETSSFLSSNFDAVRGLSPRLVFTNDHPVLDPRRWRA